MASPLGELFDHGTRPISPLVVLVREISRLRCRKHYSEIVSGKSPADS
jgi:hypothetical protein